MARLLRLGFLLLAICACSLLSGAQASALGDDPRSFEATRFGERVVLGPNWLFAPGDNPAYASSTFDDSGWKAVSTEKSLWDQGIRNIDFAWYRLHIHLRPGARDLTVATRDVSGRYELYASGIRIGGSTSMTGSQMWSQDGLLAYAV